jgi:DNA-binding MarR family transcriptional regulator
MAAQLAEHNAPTVTSAEWWFGIAERILLLAKQFRQKMAYQAAGIELAEGDLLALWACYADPGQAANQRQLAARLAISPAQVSGTVERLRQRGYLVCQRDAADRRRQMWHLTPEGHAALECVLRDMGVWARRLEAELPQASMPRLAEELDRLLAQDSAAPFIGRLVGTAAPCSPCCDDLGTRDLRRGAA